MVPGATKPLQWCSSVVVHVFNNTKEPKGWRRLHVGAGRGVNCEFFQVLVMMSLQKPWEWQQNRKEMVMHGAHKHTTVYLAT